MLQKYGIDVHGRFAYPDYSQDHHNAVKQSTVHPLSTRTEEFRRQIFSSGQNSIITCR